MASNFTIPSRQYAVGTSALGPFTIGSGSQIVLTLTRENWPDSGGHEIISATFECSFDNGQTWQLLTQFGMAGGDLGTDRNGNPITTSSVTTPITTPCRIRGSVTLTQALTTAITIVVN